MYRPCAPNPLHCSSAICISFPHDHFCHRLQAGLVRNCPGVFSNKPSNNSACRCVIAKIKSFSMVHRIPTFQQANMTMSTTWVQGTSTDVIFTMDLREVLSGKDITGSTLAPRSKCENDDFEDWPVAKEDGSEQCVLGRQYTFHRMARTNRNVPCFLQKDYVLQETETKVRLYPLVFISKSGKGSLHAINISDNFTSRYCRFVPRIMCLIARWLARRKEMV
jgi:hypothetical protein